MIMDNENPSFVGLEEDTSLNDFKPRKDCKVIINHLTSPESMTSSQDDYSQADLFTDPNHLRHYSANDAAAYFSVVSNDNTFEFNKKR